MAGTSGRTRVVFASRIHDCVGPREKAGPKPMLDCAVAVERRESVRMVFECIVLLKRCEDDRSDWVL